MDRLIRQAIDKKLLLEFSYDRSKRVVEPHVYGLKDGKRQLLTYQIRGYSASGNLPDWRRFDLDGITGLAVLNEHFPGPRDFSGWRDSSFDQILAVVR